jgi:DedD protein
MDSALKQRLLGAAVLIALAIIFVPMFLSNTPQQAENTTLNLDIPKVPERKFETRTLPVVDTTSTSAPVSAVTDPNKVTTVDTKAPPKVDLQPDAAPAPTPVATPAPKSPVATPAPTPAPTPTPAPVAAAADGRFAVNLGVYADRGHADALVAKLKKAGYAAYDETTDYQGKPAARVRVGPFADRAAAENARLKIKQSEPKVPSSVVESSLQPTADAPATAVAANRAGGWALQVGAFKSEAEANKLRDRLRAGGIASFVERSGTGDTALWRVRAGPYADRNGAESARGGIDEKFKVKGMIVTQP